MASIKDLERQAESFLKQKEYLQAFDKLEEAIQKLDVVLGQKIDNYKQQVLLQKRFEFLVFAESITNLVRDDQLKQRTSTLQRHIRSVKTVNGIDTPVKTLSKDNNLNTNCDDDEIKVIRSSGITWANIAGLSSVKQVLEETVSWPLIYPDEMSILGNLLKGLLLYGPPGCGKTLLAKAAAGSLNASLIIVTPSEILNKYLGESEKQVSNIFVCARRVSPCIILFDEIDKLLPMPDSFSSSDALRRVEGELLSTLDGLQDNTGIIVLFTTNEPERINPALIRAGRIDRHIFVPPPDTTARLAIFSMQLKNIPLGSVTVKTLAQRTAPTANGSFSGADIAQIANELKKALFRQWVTDKEVIPKQQGESIPLEKRSSLTQQIVEEILSHYLPGLKPNLLAKFDEWKKLNG